MKTSLELPDELYAEAKVVAAKRHTTLRAMFEHALRREIGEKTGGESPYYRIGPDGIPRIRRDAGSGKVRVTTAMIRELMEEE